MARIRKTADNPPRVSVIDLIEVVTKAKNPRATWADLQSSHPGVVGGSDNLNEVVGEVVGSSYDFKNDFQFLGRGQRGTPVINAQGAIMIINLLPGT